MVNAQLYAPTDWIPRKTILLIFLDGWLGPQETEWTFRRSEKSLAPAKIWTTNHRLWISMHQNIICPKIFTCYVNTKPNWYLFGISVPGTHRVAGDNLFQGLHFSDRMNAATDPWFIRSVYWQQIHYDTQVLVSRLTVTQMVTHLRQEWRHNIIDRFTPVDRKVDWKSALPII